MLTFAASWWLSGLATVPLVRWLHRLGRHRRSVIVPRAALWSGASHVGPTGVERQPPDPAWRRRALIVALLCLALAEPRTPAPGADLTIWVDDSLSMLTREAQGTRLELAFDKVRTLLAQHAYRDVQVRRLGDPWHAIASSPTADAAHTIAAEAGRNGLVAAPPDPLLLRNRTHWLVTDGVHVEVADWGKRAPDRVVRVGSVDRNVGLELLSVRRNLQDPAQVDVQVTVRNGGATAEHRDLVIRAGSEALRSPHDLAPGTAEQVRVSVRAVDRVQAVLTPADALPEDDAIAVDLAVLARHSIVVDASCPRALRAALAAHPALAVSTAPGAKHEAAIDCGSAGFAATFAAPTLRVRNDRVSAVAEGLPLWSPVVPRSRHVALDPPGLRIVSRITPVPGDTVLLAIGGDPVIVRRAGQAVIDTTLDFASSDAARDPAMALITNLLMEELLGTDLLDVIAIKDRGDGSARVVPTIGADRATNDATATTQLRYDTWSQPVLVLASVLLLWEVLALALQWYRLRTSTAASAA